MSPTTSMSPIERAIAHLEAVTDPEQHERVAQVIAFARAHPDALVRTCPEAHLTGSALVVDPATRRLLVLHHTKLRKWLQPGGHADGEGDLAAVALREATEETGIDGLEVRGPAIDVDIHRVEPPHEPAHLHLDVRFVVVAPPGAEAVGNHESTALRWVSFDELCALSDEPGLRRLARLGLARLGG